MQSSNTKRLLAALCATFCVVWAHAQPPPKAHAKRTLVGHYYLQSVRETGSELLLRPDGRFEWMMSYGAVDQFAQGHWQAKGNTVTLTSTPPDGHPVFRLLGEEENNFRKLPVPGIWVATVGVRHVGPAQGMEVQFESRSGNKAVAVSQANGDAIVSMPANETWSRAGLRRQGSADAMQWFDIPPQRAQERIASFALDNAQWIIPQAFETMELKREGEKLVSPDRTMVYQRE